MMSLKKAWVTAAAYVAFAALVTAIQSVNSMRLCEDNSLRISNVGESGTIVTDLSTNNVTVDNPCIMKIETCSACKIEINPVPQEDFEFFCKTGVLQNAYCSLGCDYLHIFDMYYMNETRTAQYYKQWSDFSQPFVSESSNIFIMLCHGQSGRYKFSMTFETIKKLTEKSGTFTDSKLQHGVLSSPFFPRGYYLNHEVYQYIIKGLQERDRILLVFDDWHLATSSALYYEDGTNEGSYTGASLRPSIVTDTNTLRFVFHTGEALSPSYGRRYMGFKAAYSFHNSLSVIHKPVTKCRNSGYFLDQVGGHFEFSYFAVQSQLYDCVWVIKRQPSYTGIYLKITNIRIIGYGKSGNLVVRSGLTSDSRVIGNISLSSDHDSILMYREPEGLYIRLTAKLSSSDKIEMVFASFRDTNMCQRDPGMFECDSRKCISQTLTCDSYDHCGDNSDEDKACGVYTPAWDQSYQYTITIGVIVPMVISVFLVMVICLLFVLIRRCRRQRMENTQTADRIRTLSEDVSPTREPGNRRRRRRRRRLFNAATERDNPPTYDEAIQSPPSWYLNVGFSNPADPNSPQPPPYTEVGSSVILTNQTPGSPASSHSSQSEVTIDSRRQSLSSSSSDGGFRDWNDQENDTEGRRGRLGRHVSSSDDSEDEQHADTRISQRLVSSSNHDDLEVVPTGSSNNVTSPIVSSENRSTKQKDKHDKSADVDKSNDKDKHIDVGESNSMDIPTDGQSKVGANAKRGNPVDSDDRIDLSVRNNHFEMSGRDDTSSVEPNMKASVSSLKDKSETESNKHPTRQTHAGVSNIEMNRLDDNRRNATRPSLSNQRGISRSVGNLSQNQGPSLNALSHGTRRSLAAQTLPEDDITRSFIVDVDTNEVHIVNSGAHDNARPYGNSRRINNHTTRPYETSNRTSPRRSHFPDTVGRRSDRDQNSIGEAGERNLGRNSERFNDESLGTQQGMRSSLPDVRHNAQGQPLGRVTSVNYIPLFIDGNPEDDIYV